MIPYLLHHETVDEEGMEIIQYYLRFAKRITFQDSLGKTAFTPPFSVLALPFE
jgi:hypothetical protein